jgi:hypothetical protein
MPRLSRHHFTRLWELENWNVNIGYATRVHDLPWYLPQITLFTIPVTFGKPNFQQFFHTFKELNSTTSLRFSHPQTAAGYTDS